MRVVVDTNIWISGMLWRGAPWQLLRMAEQGEIELCVTPSMLSELAVVLSYERFQPRITQLGLTSEELVAYALSLSTVFEEPQGEPVVAADPDDDVFLHCAAVAGASCIVSGDRHLLDLGRYQDIPILSVNEFLAD